MLFCDDQLTVKRARSARAQRNNSEDAKGRLEGFIPVAQDWHAGLCFLQVRISVLKSYMHHFSFSKCRLCGKRSMQNQEQIREHYTNKHLLNRTNVPPKPKNNMNAADDFIRVVLIGHVIALAMMHFGMQTMHDMPTHADLQMINDQSSDVFKQRHFHQALANMLRQHINLFTTECFGTCSSAAEDGVQMYAHELLSLGLLYSEFRDGIYQGG